MSVLLKPDLAKKVAPAIDELNADLNQLIQGALADSDQARATAIAELKFQIARAVDGWRRKQV